jgi:hypothetical protein
MPINHDTWSVPVVSLDEIKRMGGASSDEWTPEQREKYAQRTAVVANRQSGQHGPTAQSAGKTPSGGGGGPGPSREEVVKNRQSGQYGPTARSAGKTKLWTPPRGGKG